ncbi:hypothetical protein JX265_008783 [Neoarthrinium moseri]|uniref:Tetratricopeptide repeat protein n=1 Tax=Neoarthrinium moseri TaxID=1658444 RepID=A0A9P9WHJ2_9PEZI|nr:uncharacterized protein JN550_009501 [Neoarthrinium moseri]KAI1848435.1 hypothetical protein JX266_005741 [Neoarthrinium moseri]KAI1863390.1 hypothetical protein JN550_009501 [Neoarthrinium moseri]KAI1863566.1 hypothetical protein JX265_008783 [Neoarthrinium moseri]
MSNAQKFSWDFDVPADAFWSSLPFSTGRNFLQCFDPADIEIMSPQFDASLPIENKNRLLLRLTQQKLAVEEDAAQRSGEGRLYEKDWVAWQNLMLAIVTTQHELGLLADEERTLQTMLDHPKPGQSKNYSALNMMARLYDANGRYAEAEQALLEVKAWMEEHPQIGRGSPPAMGNLRMLLEAVWKQGNHEEATGIYMDMKSLVDRMDKTNFAQYQEEEREMLEGLMETLRKWEDAQQASGI